MVSPIWVKRTLVTNSAETSWYEASQTKWEDIERVKSDESHENSNWYRESE